WVSLQGDGLPRATTASSRPPPVGCHNGCKRSVCLLASSLPLPPPSAACWEAFVSMTVQGGSHEIVVRADDQKNKATRMMIGATIKLHACLHSSIEDSSFLGNDADLDGGTQTLALLHLEPLHILSVDISNGLTTSNIYRDDSVSPRSWLDIFLSPARWACKDEGAGTLLSCVDGSLLYLMSFV
ncbi:hypothetical protein EJB05_25461, partial [Eragrostis curvula]